MHKRNKEGRDALRQQEDLSETPGATVTHVSPDDIEEIPIVPETQPTASQLPYGDDSRNNLPPQQENQNYSNDGTQRVDSDTRDVSLPSSGINTSEGRM